MSLMVLTCSPDDCATAGLKTGIWDVCSRISLLQLREIKLGDIKISLLVECLGADSSAAVRLSWICAWRVLRPLLAVVIILLRATAVWDWRAMGCPPPSMEPCQEGSPTLRAKHQAGLQNCWMNGCGTPRRCLRRKPGKVKKCISFPCPWEDEHSTMGTASFPPLSVFGGIKKLNAANVSPNWLIHNWKIFPEKELEILESKEPSPLI